MIFVKTYHYFDKPLIGMEVQQDWNLDDSNTFQFVSYVENKNGEKIVKRSLHFTLEEEAANEIRALLLHIDQIEKKDFVKQWTLTINGKEQSGPMSGGVYAKGIDVTKRLRQLVPIKDFWAFNSVDRSDMGMMYCME